MEKDLKQKQIEEMARILCPCSKSSCDSCIQNGVECIDYREARALYNAGYRKADDLLKELQSMKSDFAKDMLEIKETYEKEVVDLVNEVRKETAEKFAEMLKEYFNFQYDFPCWQMKKQTIDKIDEICKGLTEEK